MEEIHQIFLYEQQIPCLQPGHEDQQITFVCLHKNCKKKSRFLCLNCILEDHNEHSKSSLNIRDIELKNCRQISNWPLNKEQLGKFSKILTCDIKQMDILRQIQQFFQNFRENVINTINTLEKDILVRASEIEYNTKNLEQDITQAISLEELKEIFQQYAKNVQSHEEIMQQLDEYTNNLDFQQQADKFIEDYDKISTENLKNVLNILPQKEQEIIKQIEKELKPVLLTQSNNQNLVQPRLQFHKSSVERSEEFIMISQKKISFLDNDLTSNDNCRLVTFSDTFTRNQFLKLRFKITYGINKRQYKYGQKVNISNYRIPFGIVVDGDQQNGCNWANSGNQVDIGPRLESKRPTKVTKQYRQLKSFSTIFNEYQNMVLNIEIKVSENLMKIYDDEQRCIVENIEKFENAQNWRLVISNHVYYTPVFEMLSCEIM